MLLHANDINAACMNDLLVRLEQRGYRFVTLESAMAEFSDVSILLEMGGLALYRGRTAA